MKVNEMKQVSPASIEEVGECISEKKNSKVIKKTLKIWVVVFVVSLLIGLVGYLLLDWSSSEHLKYKNIREAIEKNDVKAVKDFGRKDKAAINTIVDGYYPVQYAVAYGKAEILKILVRYGADLNVKTQYGDNLLQIACRDDIGVLGLQACADALGKKIDTPGNNEQWIGGYITRNDYNKEIIDYLLFRNISPVEKDITGANAFTNLFNTLLFMDENKKQYPTGNELQKILDSADIMLSKGADINNKGGIIQSSPLWIAVANKKTKFAKWLLDREADPNQVGYQGVTPLCAAFMEFNEKSLMMIDLLLSKGADINLPSGKSFTPLGAVAAEGSNFKAVEYLLQKGANIDAQDSLGRTPLHIAVLANKPAMVEFLLLKGANKNLRDREGRKAELYAELKGNGELSLFIREFRSTCPLRRYYHD